MIRIGIRSFAGDDWTGGGTYLKNLLEAIQAAAKDEIGVTLLVFQGTSPQSYEPFQKYISDVIEIPTLDKSKLLHKVISKLPQTMDLPSLENDFSRLLRKNKISAVFAADTFGSGFKIPLFGWIQDLQPLRRPDFFSIEEVQSLKNHFGRIAKSSNKVVLSSHAAKVDFDKFFPEYKQKTQVLQFVAQVPAVVYERQPSWICNTYDLPEKFFYLPNQFWAHKNHQAVIDALVLVKKEFPDVAVVCTGNTNDYRNKLYFSKLLLKIAELKLHNNFFILGLVPHEHVYWLMRQSIGVIQPSLFEGWSTTVEEAKSMGKNIILSNIDVHQEQNPPDAKYFAPQDVYPLADLLISEFRQRKPGPNKILEEQAQAALHARMIQFGNQFIQIMKTY